MIRFRTQYKYTSTFLNCQYTWNRLTGPAVNALLCQSFTTWQAMQTGNSLRSSAQSISCLGTRQAGPTCTGLQIREQCPDGWFTTWQAVFRSGPRVFLHKLVGNTSQTQRSHFVRAARFCKTLVCSLSKNTALQKELFL